MFGTPGAGTINWSTAQKYLPSPASPVSFHLVRSRRTSSTVKIVNAQLEPSGMSISEFAQRMKDDTQRWQPIVHASGFVAE